MSCAPGQRDTTPCSTAQLRSCVKHVAHTAVRGTKGLRRPKSARVAFEGVRAVAAVDVPDADAAVCAAAGQHPSGAVHRQVCHRRTVPLHELRGLSVSSYHISGMFFCQPAKLLLSRLRFDVMFRCSTTPRTAVLCMRLHCAACWTVPLFMTCTVLDQRRAEALMFREIRSERRGPSGNARLPAAAASARADVPALLLQAA